MKALRTPVAQTRRDAWTEVNLSSVEHNFNCIKKLLSPETGIMAVVKADSYGHGANMIAKTLSATGVTMFGVASVDEGIQLRQADIKKPVLILGPTPAWALACAVEYNLDITIFSDDHLNECIEIARKLDQQINVHIKIDTGMHRIGIDYSKALPLIEKARQTKEIFLKGIFSHLACAEDPDISQIQINRWNSVINSLDFKPPYLHFTNSAATLAYKNIHYNLVRCGLEIYGLQPDLPPEVYRPSIKQVMSLKGRITHLHAAKPGEGVSYGHKYAVPDKEIIIATLPVGYADGVSRRLSGQICGVIKGHKVPQIGVITMDQMMFDVTGINDIQAGDIITLLGYDSDIFLSIDEWAKILGTINYEIPCLLKVRLPRVFTS